MTEAATVIAALQVLANPEIARHSQRFFKTGPGEYGEGDVFLGIRVPALRQQAKRYKLLAQDGVIELLQSEFHEVRLTALLIWLEQFAKADVAKQRLIYQSYADNTAFINNWDLVDTSAPKIVGAFLWNKPRNDLHTWVISTNLWERRIAVLACFYFIRRDDFSDILCFAEQLLSDKQDLMHKAVGWMLREVGKREQTVLEAFLDQHAAEMPRTMLRYAIERFPKVQRQAYLNRFKRSNE